MGFRRIFFQLEIILFIYSEFLVVSSVLNYNQMIFLRYLEDEDLQISGELFERSFNFKFTIPFIKYIMPERKTWSEQQDKILKFLKEERGQHKWANIARLMESQFMMGKRSGKQCRQRFVIFYFRYRNHLDSAVVNGQWNVQEQQILYSMHQQFGNKWSMIAQKLPGRSDNCVKNHFYSKLRKSIRKLNKIIADHLSDQYTPIEEKILSKIIKTQQTKFKVSSKVDQELADFCSDIKNRLFNLAIEEDEEDISQSFQQTKELIKDIQSFQNNYKKGYKGIKKNQYDLQSKAYLKPPTTGIKRFNSFSSQRSDDSSSYLSSSSYISSCSDLSQYDQNHYQQNEKQKSKSKSKTTGSRNCSSRRSSDNIKCEQIDCLDEVRNSVMGIGMDAQQFQFQHDYLVKQEQNQQQQPYNEEQDFNRMIYEDTPVVARIRPPSIMSFDFHENPLFGDQDGQDLIQYKEDSNQPNN